MTTPLPSHFLRLRQLCLVAHELDPIVDDLCAVFGVKVCHRDPHVGQFGLHNALMPFGDSFIEVVAPLRPGTAAGRYLERRQGDGGYMVILDSDALPRWRAHVADIGVRIAAPLAIDNYEGMQLHPRDTGGALLEINSTRGGAEPHGAYGPAGPHWRDAVATERVTGIAGAVLQATDPVALATRWGRILQRPMLEMTSQTNPINATNPIDPLQHAGHSLRLDNATLRFVPAADARGDGLAAIVVQVRDAHAAAAIRASAQARAIAFDAQGLVLGGVRFELATPE